jgi:hypothetical protein
MKIDFMVSLDLTGPEVRPLKSIFLGAGPRKTC